MRPPKAGRPLSPKERWLWERIARTVAPLPTANAPTPTPPPAPSAGPKAARPSALSAPSKPSVKTATAPKLGGGDPRQARRISRGRRAIGATLDLHGLTQAQAKDRLYAFLEDAAAQQQRAVLVITGKGGPGTPQPFTPAPRGILRRRFLEWVEEAPLRGLIASVQPAHQRHGGTGAFYVFLKKG